MLKVKQSENQVEKMKFKIYDLQEETNSLQEKLRQQSEEKETHEKEQIKTAITQLK